MDEILTFSIYDNCNWIIKTFIFNIQIRAIFSIFFVISIMLFQLSEMWYILQTYLLLLRLCRFCGEQLLQGRMSVSIRCRRCTWCAGRTGIAPWSVWCMRARSWTARTHAFIHLATGMMILRMPPQTPRVAIRLATSFRLAFVWLLVSMR